MNNNISDAYAIYQLKGGDELHGLRFEAYERAKDAIDRTNYQIVYTGTLPERNALPQRLDALYRQFNIDRPPDFYGHSLSVSDVIVIRQNGAFSAHYVDSIGFVELPGFCSGKNPLCSLEDSVEQNDNQLDGIINNLPSKPVQKDRQTIQERLTAGREALRHQPKLQKKAPVKSLEER